MPRSASPPFNYSVPSGTAAVSGQVISSVAYNSFLSDLTNNALNAAWPIAYGGTGTTDGSSLVPDGSTATPAVRFQQETNTGMYRVGAGDIGFSILGTKRVDITASGISVNGSPIPSNSLSNDPFYNLSLKVTANSPGANQLNIEIKGQDGNDPSSTNPVVINFRSATASSGLSSQLTLTAATSLVISSGSTMGFTSAVIGRLWIVGFNDAGTFRLGAVNALSGASIMALRDGIYSSTAEGGAGGADSAQVIYTGTAVTSKAMTILGYLEATEATAGTWATAPSLVQVRTQSIALPGDIIGVAESIDGAVATGTTVIPADDTIPQNTEGDQYMSKAITFSSGANVFSISHTGNYSLSSTAAYIIGALFRDSTANALAAWWSGRDSASGAPMNLVGAYSAQVVSAGSTTFKVRSGSSTAGTTTFNGSAGARFFGGVMSSVLSIREVMA